MYNRKMLRLLTIGFALFSVVNSFMLNEEKCFGRLERTRRQSPPGIVSFFQNQNANLLPLSNLLPDTNIGRSSGGQVNVAQPSASFGRNTDVLGLFQRQQGVENAGIRDGNNVGATWGNQNSILNGALGWGNRNDVNFNGNNGNLAVQKQKGIPGIATETDNTNVNPLALQFGNQKRKCFGGAFFGGDGICTTNNKGFGGR